jgi:hypothetical protein
MVLLDLSAVFDTIDHSTLMAILHTNFGITGKALMWLRSYLTGRTYRVKVDGCFSTQHQLCYGVPQGSVLGPLLYTVYTSPLAALIKATGIFFHFYADDTQLCIPVDLDNADDVVEAISRLEDCITAIQNWMTSHQLKLNASKTELLVLRPKSRTKPVPDIKLCLTDSTIYPSSSARNLGVIFEENFSLHKHVSLVCRSGYFQLKTIKSVKKYLPKQALVTLVHAFISSRLDFCNSLLYGLPDQELKRLQKLQNQAARVVTGTGRFEHITPILRGLHWLPVTQRIAFKLLIFAHKCVYGVDQTTCTLTEMWQLGVLDNLLPSL